MMASFFWLALRGGRCGSIKRLGFKIAIIVELLVQKSWRGVQNLVNGSLSSKRRHRALGLAPFVSIQLHSFGQHALF